MSNDLTKLEKNGYATAWLKDASVVNKKGDTIELLRTSLCVSRKGNVKNMIQIAIYRDQGMASLEDGTPVFAVQVKKWQSDNKPRSSSKGNW
jgi:hypothetical protein